MRVLEVGAEDVIANWNENVGIKSICIFNTFISVIALSWLDTISVNFLYRPFSHGTIMRAEISML